MYKIIENNTMMVQPLFGSNDSVMVVAEKHYSERSITALMETVAMLL